MVGNFPGAFPFVSQPPYGIGPDVSIGPGGCFPGPQPFPPQGGGLSSILNSIQQADAMIQQWVKSKTLPKEYLAQFRQVAAQQLFSFLMGPMGFLGTGLLGQNPGMPGPFGQNPWERPPCRCPRGTPEFSYPTVDV
ncbi:MAG: hypothetical protein AB1758_12955 [Candidatus Eremiobacterota bacterium]